MRLAADAGLLMHIDFPTVDLVALAVSQENSRRYCYAATRMQLRILGMSEERMQALEQRLVAGELDPRAAAAVRLARRMSRANPLATPGDLAPLREAGFTDAPIRELAYCAPRFELKALPAVPVKSIAQPVPTYEVVRGTH